MHRHMIGAAGLLALALTLGARAGHAQWSIGPHIGYDVDGEEIVVGTNLQFGIKGAAINGSPLTISPGFDYYAGVEGASLFVVDFDAFYPIEAGPVAPFVGGGLYYSRLSIDAGTLGNISSTDVGLNLAGGLLFGPPGPVRPFAEGRLRVGDGSTLILSGGLSFRLGR